MYDDFLNGFCKVKFLCYAGDPNWLGWAVLGIGALTALAIVFVILMLMLINFA